MPLTAITSFSWASVLQYIPFVCMFARAGTTSKHSALIARMFEIGILLFGFVIAIRDQGIQNRTAIEVLKREDNIIQIALVTEVGRLQDVNKEIKDTLKELHFILTEHRVNHP